MEAKKISFGFSKITKKPNFLPTKENAKTETKIELIKCLEGQEIKLVEEKQEEQLLVIPLKESHKTSAALASLMKRRAVLLGEEEPEDVNSTNKTGVLNFVSNVDVPEDIEKRAALELLAESQKNGSTDPTNNLVLPVVSPDDLPLEGATESSLDDYESIPIQDFGKAMLRGMGWTEPSAKTNKKGGSSVGDTPMVRPKGMGLGADKALNKKHLLVAPETNEVLEIKRMAYVRILGGKHKDLYGQIEGFDDHAGRVIVKMAIGGAKEAFNEFLCQPVSKKEYAQYGKCINSSKYEEYKKKENEYGQIILNKDEKDIIDRNTKDENKFKKERKYCEEKDYKYQKNNSDYEPKLKNKEYRDDKNGNDNDKRDDTYKYGGKNCNKNRDRRRENDRNEDKDYKRETLRYNDHRDDVRAHGREYNRDHRREYCEDEQDSTGKNSKDVDRDRHRESKSHRNDDNRHKDSRNTKNDNERNPSYRDSNRDYDRSSNRDRGRERELGKVTDSKDFSDFERDTHSSQYKKMKKSKHSKKNSKKSKSKYKSDSSDKETSSSMDSSSTDSEAESHKKHKKKTKKSKKQRERSRSRRRR